MAEAGITRRPRNETRRALVLAAVELFSSRGYEATTVDDIAAAAGVGRRTFFRYFRGKEYAVSPDHDACLGRVDATFAQAHPAEPLRPLALRAGELVFELYFADADVALHRFALVHEVAALRDREIASVDRYRRLFTRHLRGRLAGEPDGELRAAVAAASVVAAHNLALRSWLRAGARPADVPACRERFRAVGELLPLEQPADLGAVARRLEDVAGRLERGAASA